MKKEVFIEIVAYLVTALFLYTGIMKLREYDVFKWVISSSPILHSVAPVVARVVPVLEIVVSLLLVVPATRKTGLYAAFIMMVGFTIYIGGLLILSSKLPCSCGGVLESMSWSQHLVFNIVVTALLGASIWMGRKKNSIAI
ncbi:methylamine utilization protein MauE [Chitinophaga dinghuensis]|uniref:Methylamine utilization protein MauE n=1 Tax=Chitinophaga dinghuensis TaxID=1539050 RepID=A0A327VXW1_9BACT|nr:MauE/DoxX family redox-associated membrane protein [Chitinophaga dinghuensis]RAJ80183.1 methylamine utilization protein MauE [Chitinophaga dinghuensis]